MKENAAEKRINTQEKGLLLHKVDEHRLKARKLFEELSILKQDHLKTKHEVLSPYPTQMAGLAGECNYCFVLAAEPRKDLENPVPRLRK